MDPNVLHVEIEADSLDQAVDQALSRLDCTRAEVEIEVLQAPATGFMGLIGRRAARVRVGLHDRGLIARQLALQVLHLSGLTASIEVVQSGQQIDLLLTSSHSSQIIGRHGQALDALQALIETMVDRQTTDRTPIVLDVDGYRERRRVFLKKLVQRMVRKVRKSGRTEKTPPLSLIERRYVHHLFKAESDLEAQSEQLDGQRKIIVLQARR